MLEAELRSMLLHWYTQYASTHRLWRLALAREDALRTELAYSTMINARLAERCIMLEEMLSEVKIGPAKHPV
jgi:hypothetical protein